MTKSDPIEKIYGRIEDTLRNQYSLGYTPEGRGAGGQYHRVKLTAKRAATVVRTRDGYYSK